MKQSLFLTALAAVLILVGCEQATTTTTSAPPPSIKTASPALVAKYDSVGLAMSGAMAKLYTAMGNPSYYSANQTTGVTTIAYPKDANGIAISGTVTNNTAASTMTMDLTINLTSVDDGSGNKVSGTMTMKGTQSTGQASTSSMSFTANFTVVMASPASTSVIVMSGTSSTDAAGKATSSGSLTIDGTSYSFTQ